MYIETEIFLGGWRTVSLSNTISSIFLLGDDGLVRHNLFLHLFH